MKRMSLFGLMIAFACAFQACHSPESRAVKSADSALKDSMNTDSVNGTSVKSSKDSMPKDVTNQSMVDDDGATFLKTAAVGGMMEVEIGKFAEKNSTNTNIKAFAAKMVKDHTKANDELKTLATKEKIILPAEYPADQKAHMEMMMKMKGADFDQHYMDMMVMDHKKTVDLFKGALHLTSQDVSDFAKKILPIIEGHYEMAKNIKTSMK